MLLLFCSICSLDLEIINASKNACHLLLLLHMRSAHLSMGERYRFLKDAAYAGIADLSKYYCNPETKLGVTKHFSEIIKLQFGKQFHILVLKLF